MLPGELTPSLVEDIARLGTSAPFGQAVTLLEHLRKVEVSEATVRRLTEGSGAAAVALQTAQAVELERSMPAPPSGPPLQQWGRIGRGRPLPGRYAR